MTSTSPRVLILHAYSADNAGDGLLVRETLDLIEQALGAADVTLLASRPESFSFLGVRTLPTVPTLRGWNPQTLRVLRSMDQFDLVVGVGGGYLRAGTVMEAAKSILVMGPQLRAAAATSAPTIYLPQSIGPLRFGVRNPVQRHLARVDAVMLRDSRSMAEVGGPTTQRVPDLATAAVARGRRPTAEISPRPVLSIRAVRGRINSAIYDLAGRMAPYDGYVQSTVGGNDDRPAMSTLTPLRYLARTELMGSAVPVRVVVAVRLHAALMALAAGHYVVHLAYERKGFGAFEDLGLSEWVHPVNGFDVDNVNDQVRALTEGAEMRARYDVAIGQAAASIEAARADIVRQMRALTSR